MPLSLGNIIFPKEKGGLRESIPGQVDQKSRVSEEEIRACVSCSVVCDSLQLSPPGSSVHGILQARVLEWVVVPFSRVSSRARDRTQDYHIAGRYFTI